MAAATSATSSFKTFLMYKASEGASYTKLVDIKSFGDLGGTPETLATTTLSDKQATNILGIQSMDTMEFVCNYIPSTYSTLSTLAANSQTTPIKMAVYFGGTEDGTSGAITPTGADGIFEFEGMLSVYISGKGVNEVREMTLSVAATTVVSFSIPS